MEIISKDKTEITIKNDVYQIGDIELFYTENNLFIICACGKRIKYKCDDAPKFFREVATQIILSGLSNFTLLLTGNNMVNLNKIVSVKLEGFDLKIETQSNLYILNNANCMEYMCLRGKISKGNEQGTSR